MNNAATPLTEEQKQQAHRETINRIHEIEAAKSQVSKEDVEAARATLEAEAAKENDTTAERCKRLLMALREGSEIAVIDLMKVNLKEQKAALTLLHYVVIRRAVLPA